MFEISLAEWSLRGPLTSGRMTHLQVPEIAKQTFGLRAVEYASAFFKDKATDQAYLAELTRRAQDNNVQALLIQVDDEGPLASACDDTRQLAIDHHKKWVTAAWALGCHSIRVKANGTAGQKTKDASQRMADSVRSLCQFAEPYGVHVLVDQQRDGQADPNWAVSVMEQAGHMLAGTAADFGSLEQGKPVVHSTQAIEPMLKRAQSVAATCFAFDKAGRESQIDFSKMLHTVFGQGYHGHVAISWAGDAQQAKPGILACKKLLETTRTKLGGSI